MKTLLLVLVLGTALAVSLVSLFSHFDASSLSLHGWIALGLGASLTLLLAVGLMGLAFHSSRSGHDERARSDAFDRGDED